MFDGSFWVVVHQRTRRRPKPGMAASLPPSVGGDAVRMKAAVNFERTAFSPRHHDRDAFAGTTLGSERKLEKAKSIGRVGLSE
jgi:hypothetical protein